ncbi:DUF255 domain-containing protein [Paenibacillus sp. FSL R10-2796]|uniref:DUF255 domain-containing protein n=1 Tax=Paenibacillus sp. FSL R10-2796 TaxID=2954663 RepID=UPI0030DC3144
MMPMTTQKIPNRLAKEKSPYLLQHAHNPVNWFPGWKLLKSSNATTSASSYLFNTVLVIDLHVHVIDERFA